VAGLVPEFHARDYPGTGPLVPHGMAVILNAPAVVRFTATADPARHLRAASLLGGATRDAAPSEAGEALAERIETLMRATGMPSGVAAVGFGAGDIPALRGGTFAQKRLLANAPRPTGEPELDALFGAALRYW
jgi:alcohol dehydrogenase class IV